MTCITIQPGKRQGTVMVPLSKSHLHRLLIADYLAGKNSFTELAGASDDVCATMNCLDALRNATTFPELDCGESASTLRFLLPVAMTQHDHILFSGQDALSRRPLVPFLDLLAKHGISCSGESLPVHLHGHLQPGDFFLPGNISSQIITGLLFALPLLTNDSRILLTTDLESSGYVTMTLDVLRSFGIRIKPFANGFFVPGNQCYQRPAAISPERDWSSAAFWFVMNHLGADIQIEGLDTASHQPDKVIGQQLMRLGGQIDVSQCPDLFPALAIAAGAWPGTTVFTGVRRLRFKESNRLNAMADVLQCFGISTILEENRATILGQGPTFRGNATIHAFGDHRIAMAAAVGATIADSPVTILYPECVQKSYPDFFTQLTSLFAR